MRRMHAAFPVTLLGTLLITLTFASQSAQEHVLLANMHHLGDDSTPEWTEAPVEPEGGALSFEFSSRVNEVEWTLGFTQRNINNRWGVALNGTEVAVCKVEERLIEVLHPIPPGVLVDGQNHFSLTTDQPADDITFGRVRLIEAPLREVLDLRPVRVRVSDKLSGEAVPARLTITDKVGQLVPVYYAEHKLQASRAGVVYVAEEIAAFELPVGEYVLHATRGTEWSHASEALALKSEVTELRPASVHLEIEREVDTTGFIACDTHIHTLTFSGHGDSSVEERMVTLAGEGVELAIATDHNHSTDYRPYRAKLGLERAFTTVVGNEVTTPIGHFNAFPLDPAAEVPVHDLKDVIPLVADMRAKGARVVILNHPRWPSHAAGPFGVIDLNHFTGAGRHPSFTEYPFDAMELVNSTTEEKTPMLLFEDWFSLLNRGERVCAVGSSDSHTVGDPVGGGRTYVPSTSDEPAWIDVDHACQQIAQGRTSIAMGIFVTAEVRVGEGEKSHRMGALVTPLGESLAIKARIQAPSWIHPTQAVLFVNGEVERELSLAAMNAGSTDLNISLTLRADRAAHDAWCVWVVTGAGVDGAYWPMYNDYTLGATNPIFLDLDGDGAYQSPRATAQAIVQEIGLDREQLRSRLKGADKAITYHALEAVRELMLKSAHQGLLEIGGELGSDAAELERFLQSLQSRQ